jgi:hypothetical protein
LKHFGKERSARRGERGREKEEKRLQQPRENTEYDHASVSFKFPWISPIELNKVFFLPVLFTTLSSLIMK